MELKLFDVRELHTQAAQEQIWFLVGKALEQVLLW